MYLDFGFVGRAASHYEINTNKVVMLLRGISNLGHRFPNTDSLANDAAVGCNPYKEMFHASSYCKWLFLANSI